MQEREVQIKKTHYRIKIEFLAETDLGQALKDLAIRQIMTNFITIINHSAIQKTELPNSFLPNAGR